MKMNRNMILYEKYIKKENESSKTGIFTFSFSRKMRIYYTMRLYLRYSCP